MARLRANFANLVAIWVIALHIILLPALYFGLGYVIRKSHEDLFIEHARTFARVIADEFEVGAALVYQERVEDLLDMVIIHGDGRFAELAEGDRVIRSKQGTLSIEAPRHTDLAFNDGDDVYFVVLPIVHDGRELELRLGFDETPTLDRIHLADRRLLFSLLIYFAVAMTISILLSYRLSRPILRLKQASRAIASGDYAQAMRVKTGIRELHDLSADLEDMRQELVGVNLRLQAKIQEKEQLELHREELQKQLRQKQRLETVGTLAGGIAHEFNNVLVPIILFTETALQDLPETSVSRADLERVLAAAQRAKDVVKRILTFSRELSDSTMAPVDLHTVMAEALNLLTALGPPNVEIRTEVVETLPLVRADATLALHMIMNLGTNAFQAMQGSNGVLTLGLKYLATDGDADLTPCVELSVADTGHGMDGDTVDRIFEPFFTTRSVGQGTGLGLSVVHGIVGSFGATIKVESQPDAGSVFKICFPALEDAAVCARSVEPAT
jgi:signal transduction histidine kinase